MADRKFIHIDLALSQEFLKQVNLEMKVRHQLGDIAPTSRTDMLVLEILRMVQRNSTQRVYLFDPKEE